MIMWLFYIILPAWCVRVQDHSQVQWFAGGTHRARHVVVLMAIIDKSKRIQSKISKGKRHMGWKLEEIKHKLPRIFCQCSHIGFAYFLQQWVVTTYVKCCLPEKLVRGTVGRVFFRGWSLRYSLPNTYQNSRLLEGKQVFNINHLICTDHLGIVSHFYKFWEW